jgi:hypothetical protein
MSHARRERLAKRLCRVMGWEYRAGPVRAGVRKVALAEAVPVGLDGLEEIAGRLEEAWRLIDQLDCLAVDSHPSLYEAAQRWKASRV